jgi:hypothetical protein
MGGHFRSPVNARRSSGRRDRHAVDGQTSSSAPLAHLIAYHLNGIVLGKPGVLLRGRSR